MIELRPDYYNRIPSWVKEAPRRLHLFLHLLNHMGDDGYVVFNVLRYAKETGLTRAVVRNIIANLEKRAIVETICDQRRTIVFICDYGDYTTPVANLQPNYSQTIANLSFSQKDKEKAERNEAKERINKKEKECEEEEKKEPLSRENFSLDVEEPAAQDIPAWRVRYHKPKGIKGTIDERRHAFWQEVTQIAKHYPDWPEEMIRRFFMDWTQFTLDGLFMKFEVLKPAIAKQMTGYLSIHQAQKELHQARLERIRGSRPGQNKLEQARAKAAAEEAQNAYDRYFDEMERKRQTAA